MASRDIYDRKPTSTSRGKTHDRIMALQHAPGTLPGADTVLVDAPVGSIAAAIVAFHRTWVEPKPVTTRRAYERSLSFFARDLAANGPAPVEPVGALTPQRLAEHLDWRISVGLEDPGELQRSALHLSRLCEWSTEHAGLTGFEGVRVWMREQAARHIALAPPAFHVAGAADQLRDTSADAELLGVDDAEADA